MVRPKESLEKLPNNTKMDKVGLDKLGITINKNYTEYHLVAQQLKDLQDWVIEQFMLNEGKK